ncbi:MAG: hypothetical protein MUC71_10895 [Steroidobacteraceae bacterium]|nr:hypothetical protein [Steroidobacteraceae bacterium]
MWRTVRIGFLVLVLAVVALYSWADRRRMAEWDQTVWIAVFPVNGDGEPATGSYVAGLNRGQFGDIERFFVREAGAHGVPMERPVHVELYPPLDATPPRLEPGAGLPGRVAWSLRMRFFSWRHAGRALADIRMFVLYHDPRKVEAVPHSLGLQKGLLGVVYAYADPSADATNSLVIVHEVLHTLGASDKYDLATNLPLYPDGYGEPEAEPRHPQAFAEIMAGRVAVSPGEARIPAGLDQAVIGVRTAEEIGWLRPPP